MDTLQLIVIVLEKKRGSVSSPCVLPFFLHGKRKKRIKNEDGRKVE